MESEIKHLWARNNTDTIHFHWANFFICNLEQPLSISYNILARNAVACQHRKLDANVNHEDNDVGLFEITSKSDFEALLLFRNWWKRNAPGEDRTHDLQIALLWLIMRLTRYLLRYRGHDRRAVAYYNLQRLTLNQTNDLANLQKFPLQFAC